MGKKTKMSAWERAADLLERHANQILEVYEERLQSLESPLTLRDGTREQMKARVRTVIEDTQRTLRGQEGGACGVSETIGRTRAQEGVRPAESFRAAREFTETVVDVVVGRLPDPVGSVAQLSCVVTALNQSVMDRFTKASVSYVDYLLVSLHQSQADERRRISRELHDRLAPSLNIALRSLELHEALKDTQPSRSQEKAALALIHTEHALKLVGELTSELRSSEAKEGLEVAISNLLSSSVPQQINSWVSAKGDDSHIPAHVRDQLFLILREAVRNVTQHARARHLKVELHVAPTRITAAVCDDGRGFDPTVVDSESSTGLESMRQRAAVLGGTFRIISDDGGTNNDRGTKLVVCVPLAEEPA